MDHHNDATRRALLAALAGGFALAAPGATEAKGSNTGKGKKKGGKPKPPLAAAIGQIVDLAVTGQNGATVIRVSVEVVSVQAGGDGQLGNVGVTVAVGTAAQMRRDIVRGVQEAAFGFLGGAVPTARIAVLLI